MKRLIAAASLLLLLVPSVTAWEKPISTQLSADKIMEVTWEGEINEEFMRSARRDLRTATDGKYKVLKVTLNSPGGSVIESLEIARLIRNTSDRGLIVEIHGVALIASGATWVIAAGTPGSRFISRWALVLMHPPQRGGMFGRSCVSYVTPAVTEDDKIANAILDLMRDHMVRYTNKDVKEIERWLTCGNEQAGDGTLAVTLGLVDAVEP